MNSRRFAQTATVLAMVVQILAPTLPTVAQERAPVRGKSQADFSILDVRLDGEGVLHASLRGANGVGLPNCPLEVRETNGQTIKTTTDERGDVAVPLYRGGVFLLVAGETGQLCRVWTRHAAPPSAKEGVLLVEGDTVFRGYSGPGKGVVDFFKCHPVIGFGLVAAAVAVPIVLLAADDDDAS